ncbi:3-oxoadipate enol-lactonase [Loktanella sp. S4079]|uniref:3-oxoadipate enol-lactonase n=1 Tax=Loktanella sp. S4079 TaxID=579483 RepID=UPI0005FA299E|nr:3-oxoadipate enol-lactonase [Loktanella sp. S4079]KJZ19043.1 3-oxoadipate enol-lactonase [Loktanella sp. S4079]
MPFATVNDVTLHYRYRAGSGMAVVFLNSLGTDFRIWDAVIDAMDSQTPVLCMDKRGHGLSDDAEISMDALVADAGALMDQLGIKNALICGDSVGGIIAQGLASARPDLVAGLVLCCTGAKIGDADGWNARIEAVKSGGIAPIADAVLERWFSPNYIATESAGLAGYRNMLVRTSAAGYAGVCAAIRDTDYRDQSAQLTVPTHCVAGTADLATPVPLLQELATLIKGATLEVIEDVGHLPCIEVPTRVAATVTNMRGALND